MIRETIPTWLSVARAAIGIAETPGAATTPVIRRWLIALKAWWTDDETPWCGTFVAQAMREAGLELPRDWYRARAWLDWGLKLAGPVVGCVVVFERGAGGHVGFVVGRDRDGRLMVLGGNQGNRVSVAPFDPNRVLGYRWPMRTASPWPAEQDHLIATTLPLMQGGASSSNEA